MKKATLFTLVASITLSLAACTASTSTESGIDKADRAMAMGKYDASQKACDDVDRAKLSARQLCQLSVIYLQLAEQSHEQENTAAAVECYRAASDISPDSIQAYFNDLPVEDLQYMAILKSLTSSTDAESDTTVVIFGAEEVPDSIH